MLERDTEGGVRLARRRLTSCGAICGAIVVLGLAASCGKVQSAVDAQPATADALPDAPTVDGATATDAAADAAGPDGAVTFTYNDVSDTSKWAAFDVTGVNSNAKSYEAGAFDGRYVYFVPQSQASSVDNVVLRYDPQASFTGTSAWKTFDTTPLTANGFAGAAFDGRYLYFAPFFVPGSGQHSGVVLRYDTQATFTSMSSWTVFDATTVNANANGFHGAVFDGRYIYFVPYYPTGVVLRYDTQAAFTTGASWTTFDTTSVNANTGSFQGAVFDGHYLYLAPATVSGIVARYDTQASFTSAGSWSTFDTTSVDASAGFSGAAFDGHYVYFVPLSGTGGVDGIVTRYNIQASFTSAGSWSTFDTTTIDANAKGFGGATFDGRYLYLEPLVSSTGVVARYDTQASFSGINAWKTFDATTIDANAKGFSGSVFDGRHVYFVPFEFTVAASFDARQPDGPLPHLCADAAALYCFSGSFF